jgi:hypothetical protein
MYIQSLKPTAYSLRPDFVFFVEKKKKQKDYFSKKEKIETKGERGRARSI